MTRFIGSGRAIEGGSLALRKSDFNTHVFNQDDFRHTASGIDMSPSIPEVGGATVQETLENLHTIITASGTGFISIGSTDGYALGSYNVGDGITSTLYDAFNAAFLDPRLINGGIILVLAGTYKLTHTVTVPSGISICGEIGGTLIIGEMPETSMFLISQTAHSITIGGNSGSGDISALGGSDFDKVKFFNLILADNLDGYAAFGQASMTTAPMISCKRASNFECDRVTFLGRVNSGSISGRGKTLAAIAYITGGGTGTTLKVTNCYFDGMEIGIGFSPANPALDTLMVSGCRARTYGTEGTVSNVFNSFITMTGCNAIITNNYHVGVGSQCRTFIDIISPNFVQANNFVVTGNSGGITTTGVTAVLVSNDAGGDFTSVITGNSWGSTQDTWYITLGGGVGSTTVGDIFGPNAVDTLLLLLANYNEISTTVIVNPGTYTVTGGNGNFINLRMIGNKIGFKYPVFDLNITSMDLDSLSNPFLTLGNYIEGIHFITTSGVSHSIRPSFNPTSSTVQTSAHTLEVKDCLFTDVALNVLEPGAGPYIDINGVSASINILISNCDFNQTGSTDDTVSLVLPRANQVTIKNSIFRGRGYAASIGTTTYTTPSINQAMYTLENVLMTASSITGSNIIGSYFSLIDSLGKVTLTNCNILCSSTFGSVTNLINASLTTAGIVTKFVEITSQTLSINNCIFNGPLQTFTSSSIDYALPTLWVEPYESLKILNSRFINGALLLQVSGANSFSLNNFRDGVNISNCEFEISDTSGNFCLLDIDVDPGTITNIPGQIIITNNLFSGRASGGDALVLHINQTDTYVSHGVVQIYSPFFDVNISNNKILGTLTSAPISATNYAGLVINAFDSTAGTDGSYNATCNINNNKILLINNYVPSSQNISSIYVKSSTININGNYVSMDNTAGIAGTDSISCLNVDNFVTNLGSYSDSIVTGNIFSRRTPFGILNSILGGYIIIGSSSGRGVIVDNIFSNQTTDGSSLTLVLDQTIQPNNWVIERNKNQTEIMNVRPYVGTLANSGLSFPFVNSIATNLTIGLIDADPPSYAFDIVYSTGADPAIFYWILPLQNILPIGVRIISITCIGTSNRTLTTGTFTFSLEGNGLTTVNGSPTFTFTGGYVANDTITSTITPANNASLTTFDNTVNNNLILTLKSVNITASGSTDIQFTAMTIKYRY